jgi:hypothetical protein
MKEHDSFDNTDTIAHLIFSKPECIREGFSYEDVFLETRISRGASISGLCNLLQTDVIMQATFNGVVCCPVAKTLFSKLRAHGLPIYVRSDKIADIFWDPLMPLTDTKEISFVFKSTYPYLASCRDMVRLVLSESKVTVHYYRIQSNKVSELRRDARFSATLSVACDAGDNNKFSKAPSNRLSLLRHEVFNAATSQEAAVLLAEHSEVLSLLTFKLTSMQANMVAKVVKVLSRPLLSSVGGVLLTQGGDPVLYSCIANNSHTVMTSKVSNERVRELSARSGVVVCPSTGSGKTLIGLVTLALLRAPDIPNLAVVPDLLVLHWKSEMTKHGFPTTGVRFFRQVRRYQETCRSRRTAVRHRPWRCAHACLAGSGADSLPRYGRGRGTRLQYDHQVLGGVIWPRRCFARQSCGVDRDPTRKMGRYQKHNRPEYAL